MRIIIWVIFYINSSEAFLVTTNSKFAPKDLKYFYKKTPVPCMNKVSPSLSNVCHSETSMQRRFSPHFKTYCTWLLLFKAALTLPMAIQGFLSPITIVDRSWLVTLRPKGRAHAALHMVLLHTRMFCMWQLFFQVPLELAFALFVHGTSRNIFVAIECLFEVSLSVYSLHDLLTTRLAAGSTGPAGFIVMAITVFFFFLGILPRLRDREDDGVCIL